MILPKGTQPDIFSLPPDKELTILSRNTRNKCKHPQHKREELFNIDTPPPL
jgi:hypothetical protein